MRRRCPFVCLATFTLLLAVGAPQFSTFSFLPAVAQTTQDRKAEADRFFQQGIQQYQVSQFTAALQSWQQALTIYREIKHRQGEGNALGGLGLAYDALGNYAKAIELQEQSLAIAREIKDRQGEGRALGNLGNAYGSLNNYAKAIEYLEKTLAISREIKDRNGEGITLSNLGIAYESLGNYAKAIEFQQQRLAIAREIKDRQGEVNALSNLGIAYFSLSNYAKAIEFQQQRLAIAREIKDRQGEVNALVNLGIAYESLGNYAKAIEFQQQGLAIAREIKNREGEGASLSNLGLAYRNLGNYAKAIEYAQQSLAIAREIKNRQGEGKVLGNLGLAYQDLGNYAKGIEYAQQSLAITRKIKDRQGEVNALGNLGIAYYALGNYAKAVEFHEQSLAIFREIKDRLGEGNALGNLGNAYLSLGNYAKAIEFQQQSLAIAREIKDRQGEGHSLGGLGVAHGALGNYAKAIEFHEQSLAIKREIKDREGERISLNNIGLTLQKQQQSDLAIVFYKQSVNVSESIRGDLRPLTRDLQTSYTQTVAGTYRNLADLLIQQGRIAEAQQVIELLKVQELNDLDLTQRTNPKRLAELALNSTEQEIQAKHDNLIAFGAKVSNCQQNCQPLENQLEQLRADFKRYTANIQAALEKAKLKGDLFRIDDRNKDFIASSSKIVDAQPGTVLIYPLVLPDKIHLLWAAPGGILSSTTCPMGDSQLNTTITAFQLALKNPNDLAGVKQQGKILYDCLIKPLEEKGEWDKNNIQNLVIAADRTLNYIPIGALHDGKQFLAERYTISNILNAGLTDVATKLPANPTILGLGVSDALDGFSALPNVPAELKTIIRSAANPAGLYPGDLNLNQTATLARFKTELKQRSYDIVHIATHGQFNPTQPQDSFLLLSSGQPGIGDRFTVNRIEQQDALRKVHLVVLSACQTASGQSSTSGIEIQGLSAAFVRDRAKAVIASLWNVNDASTALLMQQFYKNLATGKMTKAEALRQVQRDFITGKFTAQDAPNRSDIEVRVTDAARQMGPTNFSHPYYWAPFILIGNSL